MAQIDACNILPLQMDLLVYRQSFLLEIKLILNYSTVEVEQTSSRGDTGL